MALQFISNTGKIAIGSDSETKERGLLMKMTNRTGGNTVKGQLVSASSSYDVAFALQSSEFDAFGVVYEGGVADGNEAWIWVSGSIAQVLWQDSQSSTRAYVALASATDGRAYNVAVPSANPVVAEHFKEIGHVLESKSAGTNILVLVHLHFN